MKRINVAAAAFLAFTQIVPFAKADVRMYVRHEVADYVAWRRAYDAFDGERRGLGVNGHAVYRSVDDGNDVTVWHDFATVEAAKAFAASPNLKGAMQKAGVKGPPQIWFVIQSEK